MKPGMSLPSQKGLSLHFFVASFQGINHMHESNNGSLCRRRPCSPVPQPEKERRYHIFLRLRTWEIGVVFFVLSLSLASPVCALSLIGPLKRNLSSVEAFLLFLKGDLGKYYRCGVQIYFPTRLFPHFPWRSDLYTPSLVSLLQPQ